MDPSDSAMEPLDPPAEKTPPEVGIRRTSSRFHTLDAFHHRGFRAVFGAVFWSGGAFWLQQVAIGWLIYDLTESAFLTSVVMGLDAVPILFVGPIGGVLADSLDRRKLMGSVYIYHGLLALGLGTGVMTGFVRAPHIFAFGILSGFSLVIAEPARTSLIANIVPRRGLMNAFALTTLGFNSMRLLAPAIGGLLIDFFGAGVTLATEAVLMLTAASFAFSIRVQERVRPRLELRAAFKGLIEGARYIVGQPLIIAYLVLGVTPPLIVFPFVLGLLPVYAAEVFDVGPAGLGIMMSAAGAGGIIGTVVMASFGDIRYKGRLIIVCGGLSSLAMATFSQNPMYWLAFANLVVLSAFIPVMFTTAQAGIQGIVEDEFRGRVAGLSIVTWGAFPIGSLVAGAIAQSLGAPAATLIGAGMLAAALVALMTRFRFMWSME